MLEVLVCISAVSSLQNRCPYQRNNDFAIRVRLEVVGRLEGFAKDTMVVDLAVDGQGNGFLVVDERLRSGVCPCKRRLHCVCRVATYRRRQYSGAREPRLPTVRIFSDPIYHVMLTAIVRNPVATCKVSVIVFAGAYCGD